jgi:ubiquinone/menaquinone biosynthesis C-methylase UbiE
MEMEVSNNLKEMYGDYYLNQKVLLKRKIAGQQTLYHIKMLLPDRTYRSVIDIGAGDGSVLEELDKTSISNELHAVEISESGCASIRSKKIPKLTSVQQFDGYNIPANKAYYELGLLVHVLEHVEHERALLHEAARVCEYIYIEVPLELTLKLSKNIEIASKYGHINFYNSEVFVNLLTSSGLEILNLQIFSASLNYEKFLDGALKGSIKYTLRSAFLRLFPRVAPNFVTYIAGAYCRVRK